MDSARLSWPDLARRNALRSVLVLALTTTTRPMACAPSLRAMTPPPVLAMPMKLTTRTTLTAVLMGTERLMMRAALIGLMMAPAMTIPLRALKEPLPALTLMGPEAAMGRMEPLPVPARVRVPRALPLRTRARRLYRSTPQPCPRTMRRGLPS